MRGQNTVKQAVPYISHLLDQNNQNDQAIVPLDHINQAITSNAYGAASH
jgi:hypothetical protein